MTYPLPTNWTLASTFQPSDQNNANTGINYAWLESDGQPISARVATVGTETYTIVSGAVTTITGTTIDGVSVAVNDVVLIKDSPAATGTGSALSTQPGNGLYTVTAVASNITVARLATMSSTSAQATPAGRIVFVGPAGTVNGVSIWQVQSPSSSTAFTYGTTAMKWGIVTWNLAAIAASLVPATTKTYNLGSSSEYWANLYAQLVYLIGSSYVTELLPNSGVAATQTLTLPAPTTDTIVSRTSTDTLTNKTLTSPTISTPTISAPVLSGSTTGTYTLAGTPTISSPTITSPTISSPTISSPTITGTGIPNVAIQQAAINNFNHALQSQTVVSGTAYYITNSGLTMPASALTGMTANSTAFVWNLCMTKTAAGTGTFQIIIYRGTHGSTSDTADVTQSIGTQTAVIDEMNVQVMLVVTTTGAAGAYYWSICPDNRASVPATAAGFGVPGTASNAYLTGTVSSVALNTASLIFSLGFVATTGTPTITIPIVQAYAYNMD
jgi:hypothetical protein